MKLFKIFSKIFFLFGLSFSPDQNDSFYGEIEFDGSPNPEENKAALFNARLLWGLSRAYRILGQPELKVLADRYQKYFLSHFISHIDPNFTGVYTELYPNGTVSNPNPNAYCVSNGVSSLTEHYLATGNNESLQVALDLFQTLENCFHDVKNDGYVDDLSQLNSTGDGNVKSASTHLHLIESYINLYRSSPTEYVEYALRNVINLWLTKFIDRDTFHQHSDFTLDWRSLYRVDNYGHDLMFSWLIVEAAETLQDSSLILNTSELAIKIIDQQVKEGMNISGAFIYEKGETYINDQLEWWPQCEAIDAFITAYQISGDSKYITYLEKTWNWIQNNLIDYTYGEWYGGLTENGEPDRNRVKGWMWRGPYHNVRMGFKAYEKL